MRNREAALIPMNSATRSDLFGAGSDAMHGGRQSGFTLSENPKVRWPLFRDEWRNGGLKDGARFNVVAHF
jgi:hypothetical protein